MEFKGNSRYERNMNKKERTFAEWFKNSLTRHDITLGEAIYPAVIQDQNQANNKGLSDDKYLIVENTTPTNVGSIVGWSEQKWLVFSNEFKTIKTHKQQIIKMCNHQIKWVKSDGTVNGNGEGQTAYVQNNTLYTLGVSMSGANSWITNAKMSMYMPDNEETRSVGIGQRLFIGDNVYEIMMKDFVSRKGLIYYLMEENFYNPETDDFESKVADRWKKEDLEVGISSNTENNIENNTVKDNLVLSLSGNNIVKIGKSITITANLVDETGNVIENPVNEWVLNDVDNIVSVIEKDQGKIVIRVPENFQYVGKQFTVVAFTEEGLSSSKTVNIVSPY